MAADEGAKIFRFGVFEADSATGELRKSGIRLRLQDQPFHVLLMLVQRRGQLVSREDLRQDLWPADTFVDFDHGLNTIINRLREVLGDSASNPVLLRRWQNGDIVSCLPWNRSIIRVLPPALRSRPVQNHR
jgi:cholera toxin transcriptional activator